MIFIFYSLALALHKSVFDFRTWPKKICKMACKLISLKQSFIFYSLWNCIHIFWITIRDGPYITSAVPYFLNYLGGSEIVQKNTDVMNWWTLSKLQNWNHLKNMSLIMVIDRSENLKNWECAMMKLGTTCDIWQHQPCC